jgi:hypothetical protein
MGQSGRPELAIALAGAGVLVAIGVPALGRGNALVGWACVGGAGLALGWLAVTIWRARR